MKAFLSGGDRFEGVQRLRTQFERAAVDEVLRILGESESMRPGYAAADRMYLGPINGPVGPTPAAREILRIALAAFVARTAFVADEEAMHSIGCVCESCSVTREQDRDYR